MTGFGSPRKAILIMREGAGRSGGQDAELIAISVLRFLADRPEELGRFLSASGTDPAAVRARAADRLFLCGVLDFLLDDEALLLAFAAEAGLAPAAILLARRRLEPGRRPLESGES
jgi:hypothetical protein